MGLFTRALNAAAAAVQTIIDISTEVAKTATQVIRKEYQRLREQYSKDDVSQKKHGRFEQLKAVNDEIIELERKHRCDGRLQDYEGRRLAKLNMQRQQLRQRIDAAREFELAGDIAEHGDQYGAIDVDPISPNELTRLGGQVVFGKICKICNRPMAIRWPTKVRKPGFNDLFWGCTGFFFSERGQPSCRHTERLSKSDMKLFGHLRRPGMELKANRLEEIVLRPETCQHIKKRLKYAINEETEDYLCPVHQEKMILKTKSSAADLLDLYYLRCPRCDQIVKIKSPTQLDAVLDSYSESGLFGA